MKAGNPVDAGGARVVRGDAVSRQVDSEEKQRGRRAARGQ